MYSEEAYQNRWSNPSPPGDSEHDDRLQHAHGKHDPRETQASYPASSTADDYYQHDRRDGGKVRHNAHPHHESSSSRRHHHRSRSPSSRRHHHYDNDEDVDDRRSASSHHRREHAHVSKRHASSTSSSSRRERGRHSRSRSRSHESRRRRSRSNSRHRHNSRHHPRDETTRSSSSKYHQYQDKPRRPTWEGDHVDEEEDDDDPETPAADNAFKNDGSFMEMFKKMQQEKAETAADTASTGLVDAVGLPLTDGTGLVGSATEGSTAAAIARFAAFGRRRGGKILKTGVVQKQRIEDAAADVGDGPQDAWSIYLQEVKRYKEACCDDDSKTRPLVK